MPEEAIKHLKQKVNPAPEKEIPPKLLAHLAEQYREEIRGLEERFGSYAAHWFPSTKNTIKGNV